eukprot:TRINITY_DN111793_c0_g1_i1.p1 TRINITY_DN111793_c0_g1~~TRINITY_DN111793_c0_g1_i1.p1  ORF type:complete len:648 (-),score=144.46 TRINITY_DN111793_c0_g1_i1:141-2084(-)
MPASATFERLNKKLPFADISIQQIADVIAAEDPDYKFPVGFWLTVLTEKPNQKLHPLLNRPLPFWVSVFNRWQDLRRQRKARETVDEKTFRQILGLPGTYADNIIKLFTPPGTSNIHMLIFLTTGVLFSRFIVRYVKIKFVLGLFDFNDAGALDKAQFTLFLGSFVRALGLAFVVTPLAAADLKQVAERRFERIGAIAEWKADQLEATAVTEQGLAFSIIYEWLCGDLSDRDALALPYKLAICRLCPEEVNGAAVADDFWGAKEDGFSLSHRRPVTIPDAMVKCPKHGEDLSRCQLLDKNHVIIARDALLEASKKDPFGLSNRGLDQLLKELGRRASEDFKDNLVQALWTLGGQQQGGSKKGGPEMLEPLLRLLCPCAQPRHILKFEQWLETYDLFVEDTQEVTELEQSLAVYRQNTAKPVLPLDDFLALQREFDAIDKHGTGYVDAWDLQRRWFWTVEDANVAVEKGDISMHGQDVDGKIDKHEFLVLMCPPEYRLPSMTGIAREMFGKILDHQVNLKKSRVVTRSSTFKGGPDAFRSGDGSVVDISEVVLPDLPQSLMVEWTHVFNRLDRDSDGMVTVLDLQASKMFAPPVAAAVARVINDDDDATTFDYDAFLEKAARAHGYKIRLSEAITRTLTRPRTREKAN